MTPKQIRLKVTKKGTVIVPKSEVEKAGANPGEYVELHDDALRAAGMGRRAFMKLSYIGAGLALGQVADVLQVGTFFLDKHRRAIETDDQLVAQLFGAPRDVKIALAPARNHPFKPLADNDPVYPIEAECCRAYLDRFTDSYEERSAIGLPSISPTDNVVLFGSQNSNLITREVLGNPYFGDLRSSVLHCESGQIVGHVPLRWNFRVDMQSSIKTRRQFGINWPYHDHVFYDFRDNKELRINSPEREDLLLVTSIPRQTDRSLRMLIFSGLHGAGTLASSPLLREPPLKELHRLASLIGRHPNYQAMFKVKVETNMRTGELHPQSLELLDAQPLAWRPGVPVT